MTTSDEAIQLIVFLRDHRFIGEHCWADDDHTEREHEGYECPIEYLEYRAWEVAMRQERQDPRSEWVHLTYYQLRSLARAHWRKRTGSDTHIVRTDIWERYHATLRHPAVQALKTVEELTPSTLSDAVSDGVFE